MSVAKPMNHREIHAWLYVHPSVDQRRAQIRNHIGDDLGTDPELVQNHPNVLWVTPETESLKRSEVVRVMNELGLTAFDGSQTRWVVIDEAHKLTPEAANSLLKLIEEPPAGTKIVLLSPSATLVLSTLRSRAGLMVLRDIPLSMETPEEQQAEAAEFLSGSVGHRFGIIGTAHKTKQLEALFAAIMRNVYEQRDFPALSWLQENGQGRTSRNTRLVLETFAVQEWQS